jgi:plastocyanin
MLNGRGRFAVSAGAAGLGWLGLVVVAAGVPGPAGNSTGTIRGEVTCRTVRDCTGTVVYVEKIPGQTFAPGPEVVLDQVGLTFIPHVLPVLKGTTVAFPNSDEVRHNVFSASEAKRFNLGTYSKGVVRHMAFDTPGVVELLCNVHAEMSAYVVVLETPYFALTDPAGAFVLEGVPEGTYPVVAWRAELQPDRRSLTVGDGETVVVDFDLRR